MPTKKAPFYKIVFRNVFRRVENIIFLLKEKLVDRHFLYFSSVMVAITCALAVILLKSFAHNIYLSANKINSLHLSAEPWKSIPRAIPDKPKGKESR